MKYILVLFLFGYTQILTAQSTSPYELNKKKETVFLGVGLGTYAIAGILELKTNPLSEADIFALDRATINSFDRNATFNFSSRAKKASDYFKYSSYALSSLLLLNKNIKTDAKTIVILYAEAFAITGGITGMTKRLALRPRPFNFNELVPLTDKQKNSARYSFFSGHASTTATNCIFAAKVFSDYFPKSKWKPWIWSVAILTPAATGYFRVRAGKHYPSDVITGTLVGGAIGFLVPHLHKKKDWKGFSITPTLSGFYCSKTF